MEIKTISFQNRRDERGALVVMEEHKDVPFPVRRVYYIYDTKAGVRRGFHAHKELQQLAITVRGSCKFLLDDGQQRRDIVLDDPTKGVAIEPMIWHEMYDFSDDCVLMVLASAPYDESDYLRSYEEFCQYAKK